MNEHLIAAMRRIEKNTKGYDKFSTMGMLHEIATTALVNDALARLPEPTATPDGASPSRHVQHSQMAHAFTCVP